jgi:hypothetical protein
MQVKVFSLNVNLFVDCAQGGISDFQQVRRERYNFSHGFASCWLGGY